MDSAMNRSFGDVWFVLASAPTCNWVQFSATLMQSWHRDTRCYCRTCGRGRNASWVLSHNAIMRPNPPNQAQARAEVQLQRLAAEQSPTLSHSLIFILDQRFVTLCLFFFFFSLHALLFVAVPGNRSAPIKWSIGTLHEHKRHAMTEYQYSKLNTLFKSPLSVWILFSILFFSLLFFL